ncbi:hypothetical protein CHS0354_040596 [Potamilus streckersoni]|uniref:CARD domain-containing protein n=1 Tax=Potamilus streckersoni TaxID=2493646 RepID=A0AAE0VVJ9_9BIVA|nr:hypothetical protein CHS0354_040596 [Potamilus streckersoni]
MIQRNYRFLLENLMAKCMSPWLVQHRVLSPDDEIQIRKGLSERASTELLLPKLVHSKPGSFATFLEALRQTNQEFIATALERNEKVQHRESEKSRPRIKMRTTLFGGQDMQPLIHAEASVVERINMNEWENVRGTIFKETGSLFNEATDGSLIFHITPYSKRAYHKLLKFCKSGSFDKLLTNLLSDEKTKLLLLQGPFIVKIELFAIGVIEESGRSDVAKFMDRLTEEIDTVVDEIDPMNFQKPFIDRELLSQAYFNQLSQSFGHHRSARAAAFVEKVLEIGENAVITFMETIEKKGPEYLLMVLKKDSKMVVDVHDNDELIAKLKLHSQESTGSEEILFYETSFRITVQKSISNTD